MPFLHLHRHSAKEPLTEASMKHILKASHCTVFYRFESIFAVDPTGQAYYVCRIAQLPTMTTQQFSEKLNEAFSFRVRLR